MVTPAEAVVGHRHRDPHVDADHADLDLVLEPVCRATADPRFVVEIEADAVA
jgi:hypothetical protein